MTLPKVVACYVVCNEEQNIAESMRSLKAYVDRFVVVDSVFKSNPLKATHSTDRTREIVTEVCAAWPTKPLTYIVPPTKLLEHEARNLYVEAVKEPDWIFTVDGDEVLYGDYAATLTIFDSIRSGKLSYALDIPIFTVALNANKNAPDVTPDEYALNPQICTVGYGPRLVPVRQNLYYQPPSPKATMPVLTLRGRPDQTLVASWRIGPERMFLINHHTRQTLESYKNDYIWETEA